MVPGRHPIRLKAGGGFKVATVKLRIHYAGIGYRVWVLTWCGAFGRSMDKNSQIPFIFTDMKRRAFIGKTSFAAAALMTSDLSSIPMFQAAAPIIDAHCHAWPHWPYTPEVPDPQTRGNVEQLLFQMDGQGVSAATIVTAAIDHNPDNNRYVYEATVRYPGRLHMLADVDSHWSSTYHAPGAVERLKRVIDQWSPLGITHYLSPKDDGGWIHQKEGLAFLQLLQEHRMIFSVACVPSQMPALCKAAEQVPELPIICHHLAGLSLAASDAMLQLKQVVSAAAYQNIMLKWSGFAYVSRDQERHEYPYHATQTLFKPCYEHFGTRMIWGSDYPVVSQFMTYRQSLEAFRTHSEYVSAPDRASILGGTLHGLIERRRN